jgi:hypothetical protein
MGVPAAQIGQVTGVGAGGPGYIPDTDAAGNLLPGPAAADRKVIISWQCRNH